MKKENLLYVIVWDIVFFLCSPIFLLAWIVYRIKGGSKSFMYWIVCEAIVRGYTRDKK